MKNPLIGIIGGEGKMGKYFHEFFRSLGYQVLISDINTKLSNQELAHQADVVIISVPIDRTIQVIRKIRDQVRPQSLLMDLTSLKVEPVQEMLQSKAEVIGCHPIFGPFSGIKNQIIALCPARSKKWFIWIKKIFKNSGGIVKIISPAEHDELMAVVQVLTHFTDITLAHTLEKLNIPLKKFLQFQSPPYRLKLDMMGRILAQDPKLYGNIMLKNPLRMKVIETYLQAGEKLKNINKQQSLKKFTTYFNKGGEYLGDFRKIAMRESNYLVDTLNKLVKINTVRPKPHKNELSVLGPANTFSDIVANKYNDKAPRYYCQSISEVFKLVKKGLVKEGVVPIEIKGQGGIRETMDELFESKVYIKKEIILPINHCLVTIPKSNLRKIKVVLSKEHPLEQCSHFLQEYLPKVTLLPTTSTAEAMQKLVRENLDEAAAIGSKEAAQEMRLKILKENIGNDKNNQTKFIVISKKKPNFPVGPKVLSSLAFYFAKDKPGSLHLVLKEFARAHINLTKIETRPRGREFGDYIFYLDFQGNLKDKKIEAIIPILERKVKELRLFGSYEVLK